MELDEEYYYSDLEDNVDIHIETKVYETLLIDQLKYEEDDFIKKNNKLGVSDYLFKNYCLDNKWNTSKVMDIILTNEIEFNSSLNNYGNIGLCNVCYNEAVLIKNDCLHEFCKDCWIEHCKSNVYNRNIKCMESKCDKYVSENIINLIDSKSLSIFNNTRSKSFIEFNKNIKPCTFPNCDKYLIKYNDDLLQVECDCGTMICMSCGLDSHAPIMCSFNNKIKIMCSNMLSLSCIRVCPWCMTATLKEAGCDFMTCKCGKNFCWKCGEKVYHTEHSYSYIKGHECTYNENKELKIIKDVMAKIDSINENVVMIKNKRKTVDNIFMKRVCDYIINNYIYCINLIYLIHALKLNNNLIDDNLSYLEEIIRKLKNKTTDKLFYINEITKSKKIIENIQETLGTLSENLSIFKIIYNKHLDECLINAE